MQLARQPARMSQAKKGLNSKDRKRLDGVLISKLGITICDADDLLKLSEYDIVVIVDDSGSMSRKAVPRDKRLPGVEYPTRWQELQETLRSLLEIAVILDDDGVDLHFLNLGSVLGVKSLNEPALQKVLARGPQSGTPLTETVGRVVAELDPSQKYVVLVLTDGEPTGGKQPFKKAVRSAITQKGVRFQVMVCTGDDKEVEWLNEFDAEFDELDVTDDYHTEREEVLRTGRYKEFTRADWVMKALLGPVDVRFDALDEAKPGLGVTRDIALGRGLERAVPADTGMPSALPQGTPVGDTSASCTLS